MLRSILILKSPEASLHSLLVLFGAKFIGNKVSGGLVVELAKIGIAAWRAFGSTRSWALFNKRAEEDVDYDF